MRRVLIALMTLCLPALHILNLQNLAHAQIPACSESRTGEAVDCGGGTTIKHSPASAPPPPGRRVSGGIKRKSAGRYVAYRRIKEGPGGQLCETAGYRLVPPGADPADYSYSDPDFLGVPLDDYPPCAQIAAGVPEPTTPVEFAISFWQEIPLPDPEPRIAPGRAITGLTAFLETNGYTTATFSQATPLGPMEIDAVGTYEVDWGDGSSTGPVDYEGGPWPDGAITHQYQRVGSYDVTVTERWVATWRLGDETGVLRELRTTGSIPDFPVQQIQAVIGR